MKNLIALLLVPVIVLFGLPSACVAADSEEASHAKEAASVKIEHTYSFPGGELIQLNLGVLAQYSYIVASNGEAIIVDPARDIEAYLKIAIEKNLEFKGVFLTHSHADFVAGHTELANRAGAPIYTSSLAGAKY